MNDPKGVVAKVTCPTFEAMGQIPAFHRTYFLLHIKMVCPLTDGFQSQYQLWYSTSGDTLSRVTTVIETNTFPWSQVATHYFGATVFCSYVCLVIIDAAGKKNSAFIIHLCPNVFDNRGETVYILHLTHNCMIVWARLKRWDTPRFENC